MVAVGTYQFLGDKMAPLSGSFLRVEFPLREYFRPFITAF